MMQRVDQGLPPTTEDEIDEKNGTVLASTGDKAGATSNTSSTTTATRSGKVTVKNGANIDGAAATAATKIEKLGYTTETGNASSSFSTTVVVYSNDSQKEAAEEIVKQIGNGVATKNDRALHVLDRFPRGHRLGLEIASARLRAQGEWVEHARQPHCGAARFLYGKGLG